MEGAEPRPKSILVHFNLKGTHLTIRYLVFSDITCTKMTEKTQYLIFFLNYKILGLETYSKAKSQHSMYFSWYHSATQSPQLDISFPEKLLAIAATIEASLKSTNRFGGRAPHGSAGGEPKRGGPISKERGCEGKGREERGGEGRGGRSWGQ